MVSPHDKICKNMKTNEKCNSKEDVEKYITEIEVAISEKRIGEAFDRIADLDNCWLRYLPDCLEPLELKAFKKKLQELMKKL